MNSQQLSLVCVMELLILTTPAYGELIAYEPFSYSEIGSELVDENGGIGFDTEWFPYNAAPVIDDWKIVEGSLSFPGLQTEGNSVTSDLQFGDDWVGLMRDFADVVSGETMYLSFLMRPEGELNEGSFGGAFGVVIAGLGGDGDIIAGKTQDSSSYMIEEFFNTGTRFTNVDAVSGVTSLMVIKAEITEGSDAFTLYVNPTPGRPEPTAGSVKNFDVGDALGVAIAAAGTVSVDEIRWGNSFADVTPANVTGDFNDDGQLTAIDIDLLSAEVRAGMNPARFDLNDDTLVDQGDRTVWVKQLKSTWFGDGNLDGEFNSGDLVALFTAGEYEDEVPMNSTWATGDFDGNGDFGTGDLVTAFTDGGYEQGPLASVRAVPEPTTAFLLTVAVTAFAFYRSRSSVS